MTELNQSHETARETLRRLAQRRIPPTPENYRTLYDEIAGTRSTETFPEKALKAILARLPRTTPLQVRFARQLDSAVAAQDWTAISSAVAVILEAKNPPPWSDMIRQLLIQMELRHVAFTPARKREALEHVLASAGSDADHLFQRLQSLVKSWTQSAAAPGDAPAKVAAVPPASGTDSALSPPMPDAAEAPALPSLTAAAHCETPSPPAPIESAIPHEIRNLIAQLLESSIAGLLADAPELALEAQQLARDIRTAADIPALHALTPRLKTFSDHLQWAAEDHAELRAALVHLLQLLVQNINELVVDDQWLHGQIAMLAELFARPLDLRQLDDVEHRLKEVIFKQSSLKLSLDKAKERLKTMLASFVDHLAHMSESTGSYHEKIESCAVRIGSAKDIAELSDVIEEVMRETRTIQISAERSRDEMRIMKVRVEEAEEEISRLQSELAQTSKMVRHDQLTGALNRKGLDEALGREVARAGRRATPLCLALLDVDNFKALNDGFGHQTGDDALVHLASVIRETLRPHDTLARYGGEEFIVLLPDTGIEDAVNALARLQRELTKRFFLHRNDRILITFSAGATRVDPAEDCGAAIARADAAMYQAKRAGKNRVVVAQ
jgi:diguanylate cyclase